MGEAFARRLAVAPAPPDTMLVRVLAGIDTPPRKRGASRAFRLPRPLPLVAGVARFAVATAIVVCFGTIAFGGVTVPSLRSAPPAQMQITEVTFDQSLPTANTIVQRGSMAVAVDDVARTVHHIGEIVAREDGAVVGHTAGSAPAHVARESLRLVVRVPAPRLGFTMRAIGALGAIEAKTIASDDLSAAVATTVRRLLRARDVERVLEAGGMPPQRAAARSDAARLSALQDALDARVAYATLAVIIIPASGGKAAHEPSLGAVRPIGTLLARGMGNAAQGPLHIGDSARDLDTAASGALAASSRFGGAATGRNSGPDDRV